MVSATDPFDVDFHLGEALVTEALVEYEGVQGYGMVMGDQPERALAAASVDAIARAGSPELAKDREAPGARAEEDRGSPEAGRGTGRKHQGQLRDYGQGIAMKEEMFTQQTFKVLMQAMSRPGTVDQLELREGDKRRSCPSCSRCSTTR